MTHWTKKFISTKTDRVEIGVVKQGMENGQFVRAAHFFFYKREILYKIITLILQREL